MNESIHSSLIILSGMTLEHLFLSTTSGWTHCQGAGKIELGRSQPHQQSIKKADAAHQGRWAL